jgi:penicillin-binding protein 2
MNAVVNEGGTGSRWRITEPGFEMAGKTGTAQVRVITAAEHASGVRKDTALPWALRDHGLFISFAPVADPRYACACIVEHGALGHPQVQIVHDVLLYAQQRNVLGLPTAYPVQAASLGRAG